MQYPVYMFGISNMAPHVCKLLPIHLYSMFMFIYSFRNTAWSDELGNFYSIPINGLFYGQEPPSSTVNTWHDHDIGDEDFVNHKGPCERLQNARKRPKCVTGGKVLCRRTWWRQQQCRAEMASMEEIIPVFRNCKWRYR